MIEEGFFFRSVIWNIAISSLWIIRVARVIPWDRSTGLVPGCGVRMWSLNPTLWHIMVTKFCEDGIITQHPCSPDHHTHPSLSVHQGLHPPSYSMLPSVSGSDSYVQHSPADQPLRMSRYAHRRYWTDPFLSLKQLVCHQEVMFCEAILVDADYRGRIKAWSCPSRGRWCPSAHHWYTHPPSYRNSSWHVRRQRYKCNDLSCRCHLRPWVGCLHPNTSHG